MRLKKTWEPASLTEHDQFTCHNKAVNYIFFYFIKIENQSDVIGFVLYSMFIFKLPDNWIVLQFLRVAVLFCDHRYLLFKHCKILLCEKVTCLMQHFVNLVRVYYRCSSLMVYELIFLLCLFVCCSVLFSLCTTIFY